MDVGIPFPKINDWQMREKSAKIQSWIRSHITEECKPVITFQRDISFFISSLPCFGAVLLDPFSKCYKNSIVDEYMMMCTHSYNQIAGMYPIQVPYDSSSLFNSVATSVWGILDTRSTLAEMVEQTMNNDLDGSIQMRWLHHSQRGEKPENIGEHWTDVMQNLQSSKTCRDLPYSLQIYLLANIMRRPIIVLMDRKSQISCQDFMLGGMYLPLHQKPLDCHKTPIILGYSNDHFCPIFMLDNTHCCSFPQTRSMFPFRRYDQHFLPLNFLMEQENQSAEQILQDYVIIKEMHIWDGDRNSSQTNQPGIVMSNIERMPSEMNMIVDHFHSCLKMHLCRELNMGQTVPSHRMQDTITSKSGATGTVVGNFGKLKCKTPNCPHVSEENMGYLCEKCFLKHTTIESGHAHLSLKSGKDRHFQNFNQAIVAFGETPNYQQGIIEPTAPEVSLVSSLNSARSNSPPMSLMNERCKTGCGYHCSKTTFPFCHECYQKHQEASFLKPSQICQSLVSSLDKQKVLQHESDLWQRPLDIHSSHSFVSVAQASSSPFSSSNELYNTSQAPQKVGKKSETNLQTLSSEGTEPGSPVFRCDKLQEHALNKFRSHMKPLETIFQKNEATPHSNSKEMGKMSNKRGPSIVATQETTNKTSSPIVVASRHDDYSSINKSLPQSFLMVTNMANDYQSDLEYLDQNNHRLQMEANEKMEEHIRKHISRTTNKCVLCKNQGCHNSPSSHPSNEGYCASCYKFIEQQKRAFEIDKFGEDVVDGLVIHNPA